MTMIHARVQKELNEFAAKMDTRMTIAIMHEDNCRILRATILGPPATPYEYGCFGFVIILPANYPIKAPAFYCVNGIYGLHQAKSNIASTMRYSVLLDSWTPLCTMYQILDMLHGEMDALCKLRAIPANCEKRELILQNYTQFANEASKFSTENMLEWTNVPMSDISLWCSKMDGMINQVPQPFVPQPIPYQLQPLPSMQNYQPPPAIVQPPVPPQQQHVPQVSVSAQEKAECIAFLKGMYPNKLEVSIKNALIMSGYDIEVAIAKLK